MNTLTTQEKAAGWRLLFDGTSMAGWRGFKSDKEPTGWKAIDGLLTRADKGGDILTVEQFGDFELTLEWRLPTTPGGNSGIFYRGIEDSEAIYWSAPEFQVLDNAAHRDGKNPLTSAGANYAVNEPVRDVSKPLGEWNSVRIVARGTHIEHWMNGVKLLEYEVGSPDWEARVKSVEVQQPSRLRPGPEGTHRSPGPRESGLVSEYQDTTTLTICRFGDLETGRFIG